MSTPMQRALGADWAKLPPALQAHYAGNQDSGVAADHGRMDIEYPKFMQPYLNLLRLCGALVNRSGRQVATVVNKRVAAERQYWRRTLTFADGKTIRFDSVWVNAGGNELIEFVNPFLGLQMAVHVREGRLYYHGVKFVVKLGPLHLPIPEWLVLGHTTIVETGLDDRRFAMDFRLTHPLFKQVYRYAGEFVVAEGG